MVDKNTLKNTALAIAGRATTLLTALFALTEQLPPAPHDNDCAVSTQQLDLVRATFTATIATQNCSYHNITIGDLLL